MLVHLDRTDHLYVIGLSNASDGAEILADLSYLDGVPPGVLTFDFTLMSAQLTQEARDVYLPGSFGYQPTRNLVEIVAAIGACAADRSVYPHYLDARLPDPSSRVGDFLVRMELDRLLESLGLAVSLGTPANTEFGTDDTTRQSLIPLAHISVSATGQPDFAQIRGIRNRIERVFNHALHDAPDFAARFTSVVDEAVDNAVEYGEGGFIGGLYYPRAGEVEITLVNRQGGFGGCTPAEELDALVKICEGNTHRTSGGGNGIAELSRLALSCFGTIALRNGSATIFFQPDGSITTTVDETGLPGPGAAITILLQLLPVDRQSSAETLKAYESVLRASLVAYRSR